MSVECVPPAMTATRRCWLVERDIDDGRTVTTTYATEDGAHALTRQRALTRAADGTPAAIEVEPAELSPVTDPETQERYRTEAERISDRHDPDEQV